MKNGKFWAIFYVGLLTLYSLYSFSYTPLNLVYFGGSIWSHFQNMMWGLSFGERMLSTKLYTLLIVGLYVVYLRVVDGIKKRSMSPKGVFGLIIVSAVVLVFSNPALSYDLFNYIFNAKMVVVYNANPHVSVALDFPNDLYLRFMHNVHTPAPYGFGWTGLSVVPYTLGFGKLKLEMVMMKLLVGVFFAGLLWFQRKLLNLEGKKDWLYRISLFALNPLVLIETFGNGHNDVVMMAMAMGAIYFILRGVETKKWVYWLVSLIMLGLSISIKFASVILVGSMVVYFGLGKIKKISLGAINSVAMLAPLITTRSQRFLPWYLIWSLSFLPLIKEKWLVNTLIWASLAGMLGYVPFLLMGKYTDGVLWWRSVISFGLPLLYLVIVGVFRDFRGKNAE